MSSLPRIDLHAHAFHPKIADKVVAQLQEHYHIPAIGNGLWEDMVPRLRRAGISYSAVLAAATKPEQVEPANHYAASLLGTPGIIPFGTMHPDYTRMEEMLAYLWDKGIRGIKLHPDFQGFRDSSPSSGRWRDASPSWCTWGTGSPPRKTPPAPSRWRPSSAASHASS